jgi:hypothetical protein
MELRHRHPADAPAVRPARPQDRPEPPDTHQRQADRRTAGDGRARDDGHRYDADAQFKRGVPRPASRADAVSGQRRWSVATDGNIALHHGPDEAPGTVGMWEADRKAYEADRRHGVVDRPAVRDPFDGNSPDRYADLLTRPDGFRMPCFDGPPRREQTSQGRLRDCGVIAVLGAVAGHRPDDIASRVRAGPDGNYQVALSEARRTRTGAVPTGRSVELTVTGDLPARSDRPDVPAAAGTESGAAWGPLLEKALAGVDHTWTPERSQNWRDDWASMCAKDEADNVKNPRSGLAPDGYVRLNQGSEAWDRAEMLTQLTGARAEVREFPAGRDEWSINRIIRAQLAAGKPVLVDSRDRSRGERALPHNLEPEHVYEVTGVEKGKIVLRNPWDYKHPEPMETEEFARNIRPWYTTLA